MLATGELAVIAAGKRVASLQHRLCNPLAALMAEAQLLEMESLTDDQLAAVKRMVDLCRRMAALTRELDTTARVA